VITPRSTPYRISGLRLRLATPLLLVLSALVVVAFYAYVRAPALNSPSDIDPWFYTASFTNYDYLIRLFPTVYYLARVPWIVPGTVTSSLFSPVTAFFVLHSVFFFGAGLFAFLLFRRFLGREAALLGCATLVLTPLFYDAYVNDYPDGAVITYVLGAAYFAIGAWGARHRGLRFALAGFFAGGAAFTNLVSLATLAGLVVFYVAVFSVSRRFWLGALRDLVCAAGGVLVMIAICGAFATIKGGRFFFFMPQVRYAESGQHTGQSTGYAWLEAEPQLLLPLFALVLFIPLLAPRIKKWRTDDAVRFAAGSAALLVLPLVAGCYLEFVKHREFLELTYYFSLFTIGIACVLASVWYLAVWSNPERYSTPLRRGLVAAGILAICLPTVGLYKWHWGSFGEPGARLTVGLMVLAALMLVVSFVAGPRFARVAAPLAVVVALFAVGYASASGSSTHGVFATAHSQYSQRADTLSLAVGLTSFMKYYGFQSRDPAVPGTSNFPVFWYDYNADPAFSAMNAMYFWAYTAAGLKLPTVDSRTRGLLEAWRPAVLVLFCRTTACEGARASLARAGYANRLVVKQLLRAGDKHAWLLAVQISKFAQPPG
jgi:hypothetical protein